jgi:hypothetical protein
VHVRLRHLDVAARTDRPDAVAFRDRRALLNGDRTEVRQRDGVAVGGRDRYALPGRRNGPRKGDRSRDRRQRRRAGLAADVDPAVLAAREGMGGVEHERLEHRPGRGPRPGPSDGRKKERGKDREEQESTHGNRLSYRAVV